MLIMYDHVKRESGLLNVYIQKSKTLGVQETAPPFSMGYGNVDKKTQKSIDKAKRQEKRRVRQEMKYGVQTKNKNQTEQQQTQSKPYISINKPIRQEFWCFNCEEDFKQGCGSRDCTSNECLRCTICSACIEADRQSREQEWLDYLGSSEAREEIESLIREEEEWNVEHGDVDWD